MSAESVNCGKKNEINQNVTVRRRAVSRDSSTSALRDSGVTKHMFWDVIISGGSAVGSAAPLAPHLFFFFLQVRDIIAGSLAGSVFGVAAVLVITFDHILITNKTPAPPPSHLISCYFWKTLTFSLLLNITGNTSHSFTFKSVSITSTKGGLRISRKGTKN